MHAFRAAAQQALLLQAVLAVTMTNRMHVSATAAVVTAGSPPEHMPKVLNINKCSAHAVGDLFLHQACVEEEVKPQTKAQLAD